MPRHNHVRRTIGGKVIVTLDSIRFEMTETAFIEFMEQALNVMQSLAASQHKVTYLKKVGD